MEQKKELWALFYFTQITMEEYFLLINKVGEPKKREIDDKFYLSGKIWMVALYHRFENRP